MNKIGSVQGNPYDNYRANYIGRVVYAHRKSRNLMMNILTPNRVKHIIHGDNEFDRNNMDPLFGSHEHLTLPPYKTPASKKPVLVHVMGSGFNGVCDYSGIALYTDLVRSGIIVASIDYRGASIDDERFPCNIVDCKEAVRFLKAHSDEYGIDSDHIVLMGSSSGGYTVSMAGVTTDDSEFDFGENLEYSSTVAGVIDLFGPTDFECMVEDRMEIGRSMGKFTEEGYSLFRNDVIKNPELLKNASVLKRINKNNSIPPFLIMHGDLDETIPIRQSQRLYDVLTAAGKKADFYTVLGGGHESGFWGKETMDLVKQFVFDLK